MKKTDSITVIYPKDMKRTIVLSYVHRTFPNRVRKVFHTIRHEPEFDMYLLKKSKGIIAVGHCSKCSAALNYILAASTMKLPLISRV